MKNSPHCARIQSSFSAYLDGAVSGRQMQEIAGHLEACATCASEFASLRAMQQSIASLGPAKAPADLGMKLRLAISHEFVRRQSNWIDNFSLKWENSIRPLLVQVSAGFAGSVVFLGGVVLLLGMMAAPDTVMANDGVGGGMTAPRYLYSAITPGTIITTQGSVIVVEAYVNEQGRVYDYNIVAGQVDQAVRTQIVDQLLLSVFQPASVFGAPVRGRVVMTFSGISVRA